MVHCIFNFLGIIGVFLILIAYFLLQLDKVKSTNFIYSLLNLFGSVLILLSLYDKPNLPAILMEIAWLIITAYSMVKNKSKSMM